MSASSSRITRLQGEALLEVSGRDAVTFLHNQASSDLKQLQPGHASYGSFCNPQGRVLADFIALALGPERILLRLRREILDSTLAALGRFAMFSKVTLQVASEDWELLGCRGAGTAEALRPLFPTLPGAHLAWTGDADALVLQLDEQSECFEIWLNRSEQPALLEQLEQTLPAASESDWEAGTLRRGIARITAATTGELLPQQLRPAAAPLKPAAELSHRSRPATRQAGAGAGAAAKATSSTARCSSNTTLGNRCACVCETARTHHPARPTTAAVSTR